MHAKAELPLQFFVAQSGLRMLNQKDRGCAQSAMGGKADPVPRPQAPAIEVRNAMQGVVTPRVTVAGEVTDAFQNPKDGRPRSRAERFPQVVEQCGALPPVDLVESRDILSRFGHGGILWNIYD